MLSKYFTLFLYRTQVKNVNIFHQANYHSTLHQTRNRRPQIVLERRFLVQPILAYCLVPSVGVVGSSFFGAALSVS